MISEKNHHEFILSLPYMMSGASRTEHDLYIKQDRTESQATLGRWGPATESEAGQEGVYMNIRLICRLSRV